MLVQITRNELIKEISKKGWFQTNNIIWPIIFIYPFLSIVDYIYAPHLWIPFLIIRLTTSALIWGLQVIFTAKNYDYRLLLHISFFIIAVTSAILCNKVSIESLNIYYLIFSTIVLFFNIQTFWEPFNSFVQLLFALLLLSIFFNALSQYNLDIVINNGAQFFFVTTMVSLVIPVVRFKVTTNNVRSQLLIVKSNKQIEQQNTDINIKNNVIDAQYEQLRKLDIQKNSFINIAGHDLKNLISSIVMSNDMILEEDYRLSNDQKELLKYISEATDKMHYMLNKLMDIKGGDSPGMKFNLETFDANMEVTDVFKGLYETAKMKNIDLINCILKLPLHVKLDRVFAGQVFQNLLSNAIKFAQTNNTIKVVTSLQRQKFVFEIIDEGAAIGLQELNMMFDKLKTLNDTSIATESRLGLGLSIAKLMAHEMGGELSYRSNDNGNYFRVEFNVIN
ncbi:sensor histidine kinase [Mucilaginibacter aquaedulcis]|uniref:sensor histidine kinase n=1 Tax=Mucilaginibacter aquaedulcis TaxID=1187081 RepID=UPI0025B3B0F5|nr:HAMP domain-containing sensor histidine kinase [Mucilaginibacter aquaedulcis]MDN3551466.1 HAMP domain-containing sensor histidine kinase [Mucilaginibacter aquaedulcis]